MKKETKQPLEKSLLQQLEELVRSELVSIGYELISCEILPREKGILRLSLDILGDRSPHCKVGVEDCVRASQKLSEVLDQTSWVETLFPRSYELEISSPGINRPLRNGEDFDRFLGQRMSIQLHHPFSVDEVEQLGYPQSYAKQKCFVVFLEDRLKTESGQGLLIFSVSSIGKLQKRKRSRSLDQKHRLSIRLEDIFKAHLEPELDFK